MTHHTHSAHIISDETAHQHQIIAKHMIAEPLAFLACLRIERVVRLKHNLQVMFHRCPVSAPNKSIQRIVSHSGFRPLISNVSRH